MNRTAFNQRKKGFTLIELLIVVIIVAILAAIVVPQFNNTSMEAKDATLDANLAAMRSAVELYKLQHNGSYPGAKTAVPATGCSATGDVKGTGTAADATNRAQAFIDQLSMATDVNGAACSTADTTTFKYGPYLKTGVPNEPINNIGSTSTNIAVTYSGAKIVPTVATGGWAVDTTSGQIVMNSNALDAAKAKAYYLH